MAVKLAIFDFDGTLADTYPVFIDSINALAARHGFRRVEKGEEQKLRQLSAVDILRELQLPLWRVPAVISDFRAVMRERIDEVKPFPDIVDTLRTMAEARIALAVATSNTIDNVRTVVGASLLEHFIALECGSTLFGKEYRLRRILQATHIPPSDTLYIGDEIRDAQAAQQAGMSFGAVAWGYTHIDALLRHDPAEVFHAPADLLRLGSARNA
ncbi:HAD family hydrolase [Trinickia terrae]|uniref:HAD family hydrolase n=1 Tax=Trinickia terrae TaxID=2571161 RepID=A0A4U1I3Z4_9BURK|nr:HAD hydrolase-like protein [Trinickia terrae]TKC87981.1 HAD family hydrolase [Trinickia terrae]